MTSRRPGSAREPAFIRTEALCPPLARLLAVRSVVGLRNSGHTVAKLLGGCGGAPTLRVVNYTHPDYGTLLAELSRRDPRRRGADARHRRRAGRRRAPPAAARRLPRRRAADRALGAGAGRRAGPSVGPAGAAATRRRRRAGSRRSSAARCRRRLPIATQVDLPAARARGARCGHAGSAPRRRPRRNNPRRDPTGAVARRMAAPTMKHIDKLNRLSESHGALQPGQGHGLRRDRADAGGALLPRRARLPLPRVPDDAASCASRTTST